MRHARTDYDRIQDPAGIIPEDEPVFLIRGQDKTAADTVRFWAAEAKRAGAGQTIIDLALEQADRMEEWAKHKVPDLPADGTEQSSAD
ncbi:MAG TPA: hypothetical protein VEA41_20745 [Salinarimonas sp.]|nr:hypothetical protein [Salinarimonas sp.]